MGVIETNKVTSNTLIDVTGETASRGMVIIDTVRLIGGTKKPGQTYYQDTAGHVFDLQGSDLHITGSHGNVKIVNFQNGDLGIHLIAYAQANVGFVDNPYTPTPPLDSMPPFTPPPTRSETRPENAANDDWWRVVA